jgi:hypothetical protein
LQQYYDTLASGGKKMTVRPARTLFVQVTRIKWNPCLGWEIFKTESKQMGETYFFKFGNT